MKVFQEEDHGQRGVERCIERGLVHIQFATPGV